MLIDPNYKFRNKNLNLDHQFSLDDQFSLDHR